MTSARRLLAVAVLVTGLAGCSGSEPAPVEPGPLTTEKIVAIASDHLPDPDRAGDVELDGSDPRRSVGAVLDFGAEHVDVVVGPPRAGTLAAACEEVEQCVELDTDVTGATLALVWQELVPEEDPGIIVLLLEREEEFSLVRWGGDVEVTGDPRDLDLAVPVDDAVALLEDDRLRLEVPQE